MRAPLAAAKCNFFGGKLNIRIVRSFVWACFLIPATDAMAADSLCQAREKTYFSCKIKSSEKYLSICGSKDYLQYRYGKQGKVELTFPHGRDGSLEKFKVGHDDRKSVGTTEDTLNFSSGIFAYRVYTLDYPKSQDADLGMANDAGVEVSSNGMLKADMKCASKPISHLSDIGPDR